MKLAFAGAMTIFAAENNENKNSTMGKKSTKTQPTSRRKPGASRTRKRKGNARNRKLLLGLIVLLLCLIGLSLFWVANEQRTTRPAPVKEQPAKPAQPTPAPGADVSDEETDTALWAAGHMYIPQASTPADEQVIHHTGFSLGYLNHHRLARWVGYELTRAEVRGTAAERESTFKTDPKVKGTRVVTSDYTRSGYDRGHLAPAADMKWSEQAMAESFYLSNVCPQHPELNRRAWKVLEEKVRRWAERDSAIMVVCGPLPDAGGTRIGKSGVTVPRGFYKVVLSCHGKNVEAVGFLFKNESSTRPLKQYVVTVDSVERVTGLDFFHLLRDDVEEAVEGVVNMRYWELN